MAGRKTNLYRWDKFSKSRVYSRTQKVTTENDIQNWIKKVEEASDNAAAAVFGNPTAGPRRTGHQEARSKVEDAHLHDAAYSEAHDLLQEWVTQKLDLDDGDVDLEAELFAEGSGRHRKSARDIKREWDNMVDTNTDDYGLGSHCLFDAVPASERSKEVYNRLLADDTEQTVEGILRTMMDKDVVSEQVTRDLGLQQEHRRTNPATRMALRQKQVKENREKREGDRKRKLLETQARKEVQLSAKRAVKKEEAVKDAQRKREEAEIQHEMARIRKEMAEEHKRTEEQKKRERCENEKQALEAAAELEHQQGVENEARKYLAKEDIERQRRIAEKIQHAEAKNATIRLRLLHSYFNAWYSVVADRRIQFGKARAMSDWKLLLSTWRRWRTFCVTQHSDQETHRHFEAVKDRQRKQVRAERHYRTATLRRCLAAWILFIGLERKQREVLNEQKVTKSKMAAFLQAAAAGSLWSRDEGTNLHKSISLDDVHAATGSRDSARRKVADMFAQPARSQRGSSSARSASTSRTAVSDKSATSENRPVQAWQVTRKHVQNLSKEEIANFAQGYTERSDCGHTASSRSRSSVSRVGPKPWQKKYVVNATEHRTAAQAKILENQQTQIKEQQRLIEELTYLQKQQMLQTQITQQQLIRQQLNGGGSPAVPPPSEDQTKLEKHLQELQASLVQHGADTPNPDTQDTTRADTEQSKAKKPSHSEALSHKAGRSKAQAQAPPEKGGSKTSHSHVSGTTGLSTGHTARSTNSRHTDFLQAMEERAAERAQLKAEREAKRQKAEEERLTRLAAEAEELRLKEEEEKRQRAEAYRERKRLEKQLDAERQREAARARQLYGAALSHHQTALLKFRGWRPWRRLVEVARNRRVVADQHHQVSLKRKALLAWHEAVREAVEHKEGLADHMLRYILLRRCLCNWRRVGECLVIQEEKAGRFFTSRLIARVFTSWRDHTVEAKISMWHKERRAREHNLHRLKKATFGALRRFPRVKRANAERERRRADMRKKVSAMLTDYEGQQRTRESAESSVSELFS